MGNCETYCENYNGFQVFDLHDTREHRKRLSTSSRQNSQDKSIATITDLSDDILYIIFDLCIISHKMLINLKHTNKLLNCILTKTQYDNNGNITIHPTLNRIWKRILLKYWPKFSIMSNINTVNKIENKNNFQQLRFDLFFKIRFIYIIKNI